ncbi:MAG: polysaccharide biosynthesis protein [PVC group bacterium]|nr:polysaccharide biosynthesis protein [PVC group bacterium]
MIERFRKPILLICDLILINLSMGLAFLVRFDWNLVNVGENCLYFMVWTSLIRVVLFSMSGLYQWSFRYASISEAMNVFRVVTLGSLLLTAVAFFSKHMIMGRSVLIIDYLGCLFLVIASRFLPRVIIKFKQRRIINLKRVLIVGAGSAGEMVARELITSKERVYDPVGFIDDKPSKRNARIHGIKVLGKMSDISVLVKYCSIEEIIIAIPSASGKIIRDIIEKCKKTGVKIKIVPELHKILTGEVSIRQIREVRPEDLLGRESINIDIKNINSFIQDKVVLVTGSAGTIGSELCRQIIKFKPRLLVLYDYNENDFYFLQLELRDKYPDIKLKTIIGDIKDLGLLNHIFSQFRPHIVFHSAAHKHVPLMEENPVAAVKNNVIGTKNFMNAVEHYGVERFVLISTDKAVNPTSIMGASKRIAEMMVQARTKTSQTKFMAVRFGNVIGSSGSAVLIFKKQIEKGGPVTVTHPDVKRFFMTASEAVQLVIQAAVLGKGGEVFILDMGQQIKIADLAKGLITLSGLKPEEDIPITFTGLRPGEKLYEEVLLNIEKDKATKHDKIYITQPNHFDPRKLQSQIKELEELANIIDNEGVISKIKELVPTYSGNKKK